MTYQEKLEDLWELETMENTNFYQWLPRETSEDIIQLVKIFSFPTSTDWYDWDEIDRISKYRIEWLNV